MSTSSRSTWLSSITRATSSPEFRAGNFRVLEDNVPQQIARWTMGEAPMTIALVIEFSNLFQRYWSHAWYQTLQLAWGFAESLKPEDYAAVVAYDMRPEILTDFTTDKSKIREGLDRLKIAAFSEANIFDALTDTAERMSEIEGRKAILLITSGIDTFSKTHLRSDAQEAARSRRAGLLDRSDADAARHGRCHT